jgi:hypothetical protein
MKHKKETQKKDIQWGRKIRLIKRKGNPVIGIVKTVKN